MSLYQQYQKIGGRQKLDIDTYLALYRAGIADMVTEITYRGGVAHVLLAGDEMFTVTPAEPRHIVAFDPVGTGRVQGQVIAREHMRQADFLDWLVDLRIQTELRLFSRARDVPQTWFMSAAVFTIGGRQAVLSNGVSYELDVREQEPGTWMYDVTLMPLSVPKLRRIKQADVPSVPAPSAHPDVRYQTVLTSDEEAIFDP